MKQLNSIKSIAIFAIISIMVVFSSCDKDDDNTTTPTPTPPVVTNAPTAAFEADRTTINQGETINFTNNSTNSPTSYSWDFGNGETSVTENPSITYNAEGEFTISLTATNADGSDTETKTNYITVLGSSGDVVFDYDGNSYNTIEIGNQIWMKENLKVTHYPDGTPIPHITDNTAWEDLGDNNDDDAYCFYNNNQNGEANTYGALYTWSAAMGDNALSCNTNPSGVQGACPDGWHLPSNSEFSELISFLGGRMVSGGKMKEEGTSHWNSPNTGADNSSGFTGLPSGYRSYSDNGFDKLGEKGFFWSSAEYDGSRGYMHCLRYNYVQGVESDNKKSAGHSVRCVKN